MAKREKFTKEISIENAQLRFKNFSGKPGKFNTEGNRNFCVILDDPDSARALSDAGWNVKWLKARDETEDDVPYIQVKVQYSERSKPIIWLMTECDGEIIKKTQLGEDTIDILDWAEIKNVDLIIRPYNWENKMGQSGIKGYLKSMYVVISKDKFAQKYINVPTSAADAVAGVED